MELLRESFHTVGDVEAKTVVYFGRYRGRFHEPFDLQRFPWDRHYLCVRLSTTWPRWEMKVGVGPSWRVVAVCRRGLQQTWLTASNTTLCVAAVCRVPELPQHH